jgi:hypothetical protein
MHRPGGDVKTHVKNDVKVTGIVAAAALVATGAAVAVWRAMHH